MTVCYLCGAKDTLADIGKELDDGKYKMVKCSKCKNAYYVVNKEKMNKPKPMTNEEWFCGLSTEEKAEWLCSKEYYCEFIDWCNYCPLFEADKHRCLDLSNKELWELWLKEIHE